MPDWFTRTEEIALLLTGWFSQTDTPGERDFAPRLRGWLAGWPYYQAHPDHLRLERTQNDPHERSLLYALVRGPGRGCLILTGHYDVVAIDNYGPLREWACAPRELLPRLTDRLEQESARPGGLQPADALALADLAGGDFLPGRGLLDMKAGLAAGLAVLERFSRLPEAERPGSLLWIGVPDEEIASNGARSAALRLPDLCRERGIEPLAAINLDASNDHGDGTAGQAAYLGSTGKLLPAVLFVGREAHAGTPFSGANPALFAAELVRRVECSPDLAEQVEGEWTAPPVCLKLADSKTHYDVTTPQSVWTYFNWLTLTRTPGEVLGTVLGLARQSLEAALAALRDSAVYYAGLSGAADPAADFAPAVYTFAQVLEQTAAHGRLSELRALEQELAARPELDTPAACRILFEAAWAASGLLGPAAVVGFAALHYAPALSAPSGKAARLRAVVERQARAVSTQAGTPIALRPFFPGISDISFFSGQVDAASLETLRTNTPAWEMRTGFPYERLAGLDLPAANIGPWGRDYHQRTERVHTPYSFEVLPELLWRIAGDLLADN